MSGLGSAQLRSPATVVVLLGWGLASLPRLLGLAPASGACRVAAIVAGALLLVAMR